jgi:hypothetical protein
MKTRDRLYSIAIGGLIFWLPAIALAAISHQNVSVLWSNIASLVGLVGLLILDWIYFKWTIRLNWGLAGVYILGPISLLTIAVLTGAVPPWGEGRQRLLFDLVVCLLPPMTPWLSLLSGQIFSVLAVTIALPLLEIYGRPYRTCSHSEAQPRITI